MMKRCFGFNAMTAVLAGLIAIIANGPFWAAAALAAGVGEGQPLPWQTVFQVPVTEVARQTLDFYNLANIVIVAIAAFVMILMIVVLFRFSEKSNPTPTKTTHNALLEIAWTAIPVVILLIIAIPSFKLLFLQYSYPKPDVTIKATGYQWYWGHEYPDQGGFSFDSTMVRDADLLTTELGEDKFGQKYGALEGTKLSKALYQDAKPLWKKSGMVRQLSTDNDVVVPVGKVVHVLVTAEDVIHNWTVPSFGSKVDAVPGRVTATWFKAEKKGVFYGQCSELCGKDHSNMPITVRVVDQAVFTAWAAAMQADDTDKAKAILQQAASLDAAVKKLAAAQAAR